MLRGAVFTDPAKQSRALEILERNAQALTQIVEDVLDVSRIISGKLRLNLQEVDLATVIDDATTTVLPAADGVMSASTSYSIVARRRWLAIPSGCSRWSGTCSTTRSSSRRRVAASMCA
jgi:signal transduction histidine kinase